MAVADLIVMQEEIDTAMRLLGVTRIDQLGPEYVAFFVLNSFLMILAEHQCA
jgi:isopentenyl diphosphate isomerase/L-lactate dehydrogenase-like FMN-dependent dehydrogenase